MVAVHCMRLPSLATKAARPLNEMSEHFYVLKVLRKPAINPWFRCGVCSWSLQNVTRLGEIIAAHWQPECVCKKQQNPTPQQCWT